MDFRHTQLTWEGISLDWDDFSYSLGKGYKMENEVEDLLAGLEAKARQVCMPRWGYCVFPLEDTGKSWVMLGGRQLQTGGIITPYLKDANCCALFVATAGKEFESLQQEIKKQGQIVEEYLLDALGTAIAEATVREACKAIEKEAHMQGMEVSYPYSPGYCGWRVSEQQTLFSLLPEQPCGVRLSTSSLMSPIKSVSGIVAMGKNVRKQKYGCEICRKKDCYKNRNK